MDPVDIPKVNQRCYQLLYAIENVLRELIIETLANTPDGHKWYSRRVPEPVRSKAAELMIKEKKSPWVSVVPYHPLYYSDFPALKSIIIAKNNWDDGFGTIFVSKDVLGGNLTQLEGIRNKIAHNRRANTSDLEVVEGTYNLLTECIGTQKFLVLFERCTAVPDLAEHLSSLQRFVQLLMHRCADAKPITSLDYWDHVRSQWWFDSDYLGTDLQPLWDFFKVIREYAQLPRVRGDGYFVEAWLVEKQLEEIYQDVLATIDFLQGGGNE